jgi:hypothetical protein
MYEEVHKESDELDDPIMGDEEVDDELVSFFQQ